MKRGDPKRQLLDYVCGELEESQRASLEADLAREKDLAGQANKLHRAIHAVTPDTPPSLSRGFNATLRAKLQKQWRTLRSGPGRHTLRRRLRVVAELSAAAAVIGLLGTVLFTATHRSNVAWGEAVKAMDQVTQFRLTIVDSREGEAHEREMTELFYKEIALWRAQNSRYVQFRLQGVLSSFDLRAGRFVDDPTEQLIPPGFARAVHTGNLLNGILETLFEGNVPKGEPVQATTEMINRDVEIFDYVNLSRRQRARIWVLTESRLPVRIRMHYPDRRVILIAIDYSDPRSDEFFDPETLTAAVSAGR